ncbi:MAG: hypothetical protein QM682_11655 [Paracoccus sp. (in: a-proteobacteria)]|uniref:tetratricopeptide repeat protein n=1 Tax=Paracoccus sp. TaxID=267 RepID=UPI0039E2C87D
MLHSRPRDARVVPSTPELLFDGAHLQLIHLPGLAPMTVISFDIMHARANGRNAFARKLCQSNGLTLLGIVPKYPCWYPEAEMQQIAALCRDLIRGTAIAYGASMGGYGALRWGRLLGAERALACSPQFTIDPAVTGTEDRRYGAHFSARHHAGMQVRNEHVPPGSMALFDPHFRPDRFQARLARGLSHLQALPLPHMAHGTAGCLRGSVPAMAAFDCLLNGDPGALHRLCLRRRRQTDTYFLELAATALRRHRPDLAKTLATRASQANPAGYHMLMARIATQAGDPGQAEAEYLRVLACKPGHRIAEMRLEQIRARDLPIQHRN